MSFGRILRLCEQYGFIRKLPHSLGPLCPENAVGALSVGPVGSLLLQNLKDEWRNSVLNTKDLPVFHSANGLKDSYDFIRELCSQRLPFGVADTAHIRNTQIKEKEKIEDSVAADSDVKSKKRKVISENVLNFSAYFKDLDHLRCTVFMAPSEATQFLYLWQRHRRVWWRKFSATPGRYFTTDIQSNADGLQEVEVRANYPWGTQTVEKLTLSPNIHPVLTEEQHQNKFERKKVQSHYLTCLISVPAMYLNIICDSFEELPFLEGTRTFFRFHRKLAPYKIAFSVPNSHTGSVGDELEELAMYVCKKLKANNMSTLLLPSSTRTTLEQQFNQYDKFGIPYTVMLNESSLMNGIINLRSRDTTLSEQVHITELPSYAELLFKNY